MGELGTEPAITWYDVLGVLPSATVEQVQYQHDAKARLLRPELVAGAPSACRARPTRRDRELKTRSAGEECVVGCELAPPVFRVSVR